MGRRALTDGEVGLIHRVLGYDFNTSGELVQFGTNPRPYSGYTPDGVASMGDKVYLQDYSTAPADYRAFFLHEMTHAYKYQLTGKSQASVGGLLAQFDTDYTDNVARGIPFSRWNIEEQANYVEDMYLRSQGIYRDGTSNIFGPGKKFKFGLTDEQMNSVDTGGIVQFELQARCFAAHTPIQTSLTSTKPIADLRVGDAVLAFDPYTDDGRGALVPRRVTKLFSNVTTEWVKLSWTEAGVARELVATPGHHFRDQHGNFPSIAEMIRDGGATVVLASGELAEVAATRIVYSAATAHLFEQAQSHIALSGNTALKPQMLEGWQTYNFEVEDLHTYVACGVRVHNVSLFTSASDEWGSLADTISGQISNHIFGANTLGSVVAGAGLSAVSSTLADSLDGRAGFNAAHLGGRFIYDIAGGLGALGGNMLMQDLISGLGVRGNAAIALAQLGSGVGSVVAEHAALGSFAGKAAHAWVAANDNRERLGKAA